MTGTEQRVIVVTGATGRQGGAVVRHLLPQGWKVRALTRSPEGAKARGLAALGAEVMQGDMEDPATLRPVFEGAYGAYSVQTPYAKGPDAEIRQSKNVADAAKAASVQHLVYGSAGIGQPGTGVPSWESKLQIEQYMHDLGLPLTILRPMAFMELMTDKAFFPAASTWHVMPAVMGPSRPVVWLCTDDLGAIAARVFQSPDHYVGQALKLSSDEQSIDQCRAIYRSVMGKKPSEFPLPPWLFRRFGFVGKDLITMWRWLRTNTFDVDLETARAIYPEAQTVEAWLHRRQ